MFDVHFQIDQRCYEPDLKRNISGLIEHKMMIENLSSFTLTYS